MKKICVTDSGLGGLSVCALLVKALKKQGKGAKIIYFNACYSDDLGYNKIARREDKIKMFDRALAGIENYCSPDEILVACNTLSVLLEETIAAKNGIAAQSIVDTAVNLIQQQVSRAETITVFGTETTIEENTYQDRLVSAGRSMTQIRQIACPGLQTRISNQDRVKKTIQEFTRKADKTSWYVMGCTHFGIRSDAFCHSKILDPNQAMADNACEAVHDTGPISMKMVSRYPVIANEIETWINLLNEPLTIDMLKNHEIRTDLF